MTHARPAVTRRVLMLAAGLTLAAGLALAAAGCANGDRPDAEPITIFAAASLRTALDEAMPVCEAATGLPVRASYAASSALARQIEAGAPADLYISADQDWMNDVAAKGGIRAETRVDLLGNALVLIAPASARATPAATPPASPSAPPPATPPASPRATRPATLEVAPGFDLAGALGPDGRLALADPAVVPAGKYAKAALESLGVWDTVASRVAPAEDVRAALLLVSRAEAPLGIVYRTDAAADPNVVVVDAFPPGTHPPIVYPAALTRRGDEAAARVLACLQGPAARAIFDRWGFTTPGSPAR